jgi:hypothetical protein
MVCSPEPASDFLYRTLVKKWRKGGGSVEHASSDSLRQQPPRPNCRHLGRKDWRLCKEVLI